MLVSVFQENSAHNLSARFVQRNQRLAVARLAKKNMFLIVLENAALILLVENLVSFRLRPYRQ